MFFSSTWTCNKSGITVGRPKNCKEVVEIEFNSGWLSIMLCHCWWQFRVRRSTHRRKRSFSMACLFDRKNKYLIRACEFIWLGSFGCHIINNSISSLNQHGTQFISRLLRGYFGTEWDLAPAVIHLKWSHKILNDEKRFLTQFVYKTKTKLDSSRHGKGRNFSFFV